MNLQSLALKMKEGARTRACGGLWRLGMAVCSQQGLSPPTQEQDRHRLSLHPQKAHTCSAAAGPAARLTDGSFGIRNLCWVKPLPLWGFVVAATGNKYSWDPGRGLFRTKYRVLVPLLLHLGIPAVHGHRGGQPGRLGSGRVSSRDSP